MPAYVERPVVSEDVVVRRGRDREAVARVIPARIANERRVRHAVEGKAGAILLRDVVEQGDPRSAFLRKPDVEGSPQVEARHSEVLDGDSGPAAQDDAMEQVARTMDGVPGAVERDVVGRDDDAAEVILRQGRVRGDDHRPRGRRRHRSEEERKNGKNRHRENAGEHLQLAPSKSCRLTW